MYIGDKVEVRDKQIPFLPLEGEIEAVYNDTYQIRFGAPTHRAVWVDKREYDVKKVDR